MHVDQSLECLKGELGTFDTVPTDYLYSAMEVFAGIFDGLRYR